MHIINRLRRNSNTEYKHAEPGLLQPVEIKDSEETVTFIVKQKVARDRYEERILSLSEDGFRILHLFSREQVEFLPIEKVKSWKHTGNKFYLVYHPASQDIIYKFRTCNQAGDIVNVIHNTVTRLLDKQHASEQKTHGDNYFAVNRVF